MFIAEASRFATVGPLPGLDEVGGKILPGRTQQSSLMCGNFCLFLKYRNVTRGESMKLILATLFAVFIVPLCFAKIVMATSPDAPMHSEKSGEAKEQEDQKLKAALHAEEGPIATEPSQFNNSN
jgi:hypothetical protein